MGWDGASPPPPHAAAALCARCAARPPAGRGMARARRLLEAMHGRAWERAEALAAEAVAEEEAVAEGEAVAEEAAGAAGTEAAGWAEVAGYVQRARRRSEQRAQALARRDAAQARHESSHLRLLLLRLFLHYLLPLPSTSPRRSDSSSC